MSKPILYEQGTTDFDQNNGLGILPDPLTCFVEEKTGGFYELEMQYPIDGKHFEKLKVGRIILAHANDKSLHWQPFQIYSIEKHMDGIALVYAEHIKYEMTGIPVAPFTAGSAADAAQKIKANAVGMERFSIWTDIQTVADMAISEPRSAAACIQGKRGSFLDVFGGEPEFDRFEIKLHSKRGVDNGLKILYGKNLVDLEQETNLANCFTAVYPFWRDAGTGAVTQLPEKVLYSETDFGYTRVKVLDLSGEFTEAPTEEQLRERGMKEIKPGTIGLPKVSISTKYVNIRSKGSGVPSELIGLYDLVTVQYAALGVDVKAKVTDFKYDVLLDQPDTVKIGDVQRTLADTIVQQQEQIEKVPSFSDLDQVREQATAWLTNGKGYKVERRDENGNVIDTLYLDTPDINTAVNIMRVGQSGIGFSHNGVDGPYESAWTIDGVFNANVILSGSLMANIIQGGILKSKDETFYLNLDTGELRVDKLNILTEELENIANNGVDRLHTTSGVDIEGSTITVHKAGEEMTTSIDHTGFEVIVGQDTENQRTSLFVKEDRVNARNLTAENYLIAGKYARWEDYKDPDTGAPCTGLFYIGGGKTKDAKR